MPVLAMLNFAYAANVLTPVCILNTTSANLLTEINLVIRSNLYLSFLSEERTILRLVLHACKIQLKASHPLSKCST